MRRPNWVALRGSSEGAVLARAAQPQSLIAELRRTNPQLGQRWFHWGKRQADSWEELRESMAEIRRCKRRRSAWLSAREVEWWDDKARQVQDKADQGDAFGVFATFKELRNRGLSFSLGEVRPADVQSERDAWAEHFFG